MNFQQLLLYCLEGGGGGGLRTVYKVTERGAGTLRLGKNQGNNGEVQDVGTKK